MTLFLGIAVFFLLFFIIYRILMPKLNNFYLKEAMKNKESSDFTSKLLSTVLPESQIFTSLALPIPEKDGEEAFVGTVAVNRSGIYIICRIHGSGLIENTSDDNWRYLNNGKCNDFPNPFHAQSLARDLLEFYIKNTGIEGFKAHSLIIYTDENLRFANPNRSILKASELPSRIKTTDKLGKFSVFQVKSICKLLSDINDGINIF